MSDVYSKTIIFNVMSNYRIVSYALDKLTIMLLISDAPVCSEKKDRVYGVSENETVLGLYNYQYSISTKECDVVNK